MKKIILILLSLLMIFTLFSCEDNPPEDPGNICNITYETDGGKFISTPFTKARKGAYISIPEILKTGYSLDSWKGAEKKEDGTWGLTIKGYDVSLKAIWNAENYKITYNLNGGEWTTEPPAGRALTNQDVYLDEKPSLDGSHFVKWTSDDVKLEFTKYGYHFVMPSHDISLKAEYTADKYGISYDLDGGNFGEYWYPESAYKEEDVFIVSPPVKTGYIFDGWESPSDVPIKMDGDISSFKMPSRDITLKAKWKPDLIELKWSGIGDISVVRQAYTDEVIPLPEGLIKDNYDFVGWRVVPNTVSEDGKSFRVQPIDEKNTYMTIDAIWEGKKYNIKYDISKDAVWKEEPVTEGKLFSEVIIPELNKEGVVVTGWTSSDPNDYIEKLPGDDVNAYRLYRMSGESEITLTPVYEVGINYNLVQENAKMTESYTSTTTSYSRIRLPKCECEGYRFLGWKNSSTGAEAFEEDGVWYIYVGDKSITVEALWQKVHTLKFYEGDKLLYQYEVNDGDTFKMPYIQPKTKGCQMTTWYNMDAGKGNYIKGLEYYIPSTSVSFKIVYGYSVEGYIVYDDPEARDENIEYTFFGVTWEWIDYDPAKYEDEAFVPNYYSVELKNGATITKDRFYVISSCGHKISSRADTSWTYFADGEYKHEKVGADKREIGGGRYNTQLVLGLINEGEEAKRGIANINTSSPYTKADPDRGYDYTVWACLQGLNKWCVYHDWYIPSREEALIAMKKLYSPGMKIWTSTESDQEFADDAICIHYDEFFHKIVAESHPKVPIGHTHTDIEYMRSF